MTASRALYLLLLAACVHAGAPGEVAVKRDEFTGARHVELTGMQVTLSGGTFGRPATIHALGTAGLDGATMVVTVVSHLGGASYTSWKYLQCHAMHAVADGVPVELGRSRHDGRVGSGYLLEFIAVDLDQAALEAIAGASLVRVRICNDVFELGPAHLARFRQLAALLRLSPEDTPQ